MNPQDLSNMSDSTTQFWASKLNRWIDQAAITDAHKTEYRDCLSKMSGTLFEQKIELLSMDDALDQHGKEFLDLSLTKDTGLKEIVIEIYQTYLNKSSAVKNQSYESAARLRDRERTLREQVKEKIIERNKFNRIFNAYGNQIIWIQPPDAKRRTILRVVLHNYHNFKDELF